MNDGVRTAYGTDSSGRLPVNRAALTFPNGLDSLFCKQLYSSSCCVYFSFFACAELSNYSNILVSKQSFVNVFFLRVILLKVVLDTIQGV